MIILLNIFIWLVFFCWTYQFVVRPAIQSLIQSKFQSLYGKLDDISSDISTDELEALEITKKTILNMKKLAPGIDFAWVFQAMKNKSSEIKDVAFNESKKEWYLIARAKDERITEIADEAMLYFSVLIAINSLIFIITTFPILLIGYICTGAIFKRKLPKKAAIIAYLHHHA